MEAAGVTYPRFAVGQFVVTAAVAAEKKTITPTLLQSLLWRHRTGDFGQIDQHDRRMNEQAIKVGRGRVMSVYAVGSLTLWCITELSDLPGQTYTVALFPSDY